MDTVHAIVSLNVDGHKKSSFKCPLCDRKVCLRVAFPFSWRFVTCPNPKCRALWNNSNYYFEEFDDRYAEGELVGRSENLPIFGGIS